jgi:membrane fusion protein (multidrug efflux system)
VRAGELLYEINSDTYRAIYDGAVASLASANASLMSARVKKERYDELIKFEGVSKQDYDDAVAAYLSAEALVKERAASLNSAKINLDKTRITAPISGFIGISSVTEGALVTANQAAALSTIRSIDPMYVDLSQSSNQILELRKNLDAENLQKGSTQVSLKLFDGSMYAHQGILKLHEVAVDESTSSVTLRAEFPNPDGVLLPGMYVRAVLEEAVDANSYLVPQQAVLRDSRGNPIVTIATPNNTIITRVITAPRTQDSFWVVTDGVSASDKIIIEGLNRINTRSKVTPVDVSAKYIKAK